MCSQCHKQFHSHCIWGQFYLVEKPFEKQNPRFWLCGQCLVNKNVVLYDSHLREWVSFFVVSYISASKNHMIKRQQEQQIVRLGWFRVRIHGDLSTVENHVENTNSHDSIIEVRNGVRCYKNNDHPCVERLNWHSLPQIVSTVFIVHM